MSNFEIMSFVAGVTDSDGEIVAGTEHAVHLLYNKTRITREELEDLIRNDAWSFDDRVVSLPSSKIKGLMTNPEDWEDGI